MSYLENPKSAEVLEGRQASQASVAFGAVLTVLGVFAVLAHTFTGVGLTVLIGLLLVAAGIVEFVFVFQSESFGEGVVKFLLAGVTAIAGVVVLLTPAQSLAALTFLLAAFFVAGGVIDMIIGFKMRPEEGWGWVIFSGVFSLLLAALIVTQWPVSGAWAVGLFVGFRLLMHGFMLMALGRTGGEAMTHLQDTRIDDLEDHVRLGALELLEVQVALVDHTALLIAMGAELRQKVSSSDVDPAIRKLNDELKTARVELGKAAEAVGDTWSDVQREASKSFRKLRESSAEQTGRLKKELGLGAKGD